MHEDQFNMALNFMAQQRNSALDACVQLQIEIHCLKERIQELEAQVACSEKQ